MYCLLSPRKLETRCWYTVIEHSHMCITLIARVKEPKRVGKVALASLLPSKSHISSHIWWKLFQTHNSSCTTVCEMQFSVLLSLQQRRDTGRKWEWRRNKPNHGSYNIFLHISQWKLSGSPYIGPATRYCINSDYSKTYWCGYLW